MKFIPEADSDFALVAEHMFLSRLKRMPADYGVTAEDVAIIDEAVSAFRGALAKTLHRFRCNPAMTMQKDQARAKAEEVVRRYANIIRANPNVTDLNKIALRLKVRPKRLGKRTCPKTPPFLQFMGAEAGEADSSQVFPNAARRGMWSSAGHHVIKFYGQEEMLGPLGGNLRRAKPDGAARLELFFDMVPAGEPVPQHPAERGWPKYLRSFTRSPMEVEFPVPSEPMLIVYWARWADSTGEVSRWSKPCVARLEGWTSKPQALPPAEGVQHVETKIVFIQTPYELTHQPRELIDEAPALLEAQMKMLNAA